MSKFHFSNWVSNREMIVHFPPSPFSLEETLKVKCGKHEKWIDVQLEGSFLLNGQYELNRKVEEAFDKCPDCINERAYKTTRFPEGAEL